MKTIKPEQIEDKVAALCAQANFRLRPDVLSALKAAAAGPVSAGSREALLAIVRNAEIARRKKLAICQDTGLPVVFAEVGLKAVIDGDFKKAVNKGIKKAYVQNMFRPSIQTDPLGRADRPGFYPGILHVELVPNDRIRLTVMPKGFGSENKAGLKMFNPTASSEELEKFILSVVKNAGPDACPPFIVGIGVGGTQDYAALMAKKALLRPVQRRSRKPAISLWEKSLLKKINKLGIGPLGLGGSPTALAVSVETAATHIAGLPLAVNVSCHALRSAEGII